MMSLLAKAFLYVRLYAFALAAMAYIHGARHVNSELAQSIARAVMNAEPLYLADEERERTVSALVATASGESSLRSEVVGDGGKSYGPFQIWMAPRQGRDLTNQGADEALRQMRVSLVMCSNFATAYLSGGCTNEHAKALADRREQLARELYTRVLR